MSKWYASRWTRYVLTMALLVVVVVRVEPGRFVQALSSARVNYVALALLLTPLFLALKSVRWFLMLRMAGIDASVGEATRSLIGGMGLALVTPARIGELVRVAYLRDKQKLKIGGLVLLDKGFDVLALCILSVAGAWQLLGIPAGVALLAVSLAGLFFVYVPGPAYRAWQTAGRRVPLRNAVEKVWASIDALSLKATTLYLVLTFAAFAVVLVQFGLVLLSWRALSFNVVFLTFPLVILTNVLPITVGGLGVREGTAALLLSHYGVTAAHAALAAFLMFAINTALPGVIGALMLPPSGARSTQARQEPEPNRA